MKTEQLDQRKLTNLKMILATGEIDWSIHNHMGHEFTETKHVGNIQILRRVTATYFTEQVHVILLISKFRHCSSLKCVQIFSKNVACNVLKHLAKSWTM